MTDAPDDELLSQPAPRVVNAEALERFRATTAARIDALQRAIGLANNEVGDAVERIDVLDDSVKALWRFAGFVAEHSPTTIAAWKQYEEITARVEEAAGLTMDIPF